VATVSGKIKEEAKEEAKEEKEEAKEEAAEAPGPVAKGSKCVTVGKNSPKSYTLHAAGGGARATGKGIKVCNGLQKQPQEL